jgi:hypothetical protein
VGTGIPLVLHHTEGDDENEKIDRIKTREAGEPEVALDESFAAVSVVVGEDVAGDQEEDADEDITVIDKGIEKAKMGRREVEEDDEDGEEGADAGKRGQRRFAGKARPGGRSRRLSDFGLGL